MRNDLPRESMMRNLYALVLVDAPQNLRACGRVQAIMPGEAVDLVLGREPAWRSRGPSGIGGAYDCRPPVEHVPRAIA
jgi:hypothetical protein